MSLSSLPRHARGLGGYCWDEWQDGRYHCTLPLGHGGRHWHAYSRKSW